MESFLLAISDFGKVGCGHLPTGQYGVRDEENVAFLYLREYTQSRPTAGGPY
jgi:hypothetical protein